MARAKKKKRVVYRVLPNKGKYDWKVTLGGSILCVRETKREAVAHARKIARKGTYSWLPDDARRLTQLMIHGRDGKFQTEHTYGADPRRSPG